MGLLKKASNFIKNSIYSVWVFEYMSFNSTPTSQLYIVIICLKLCFMIHILYFTALIIYSIYCVARKVAKTSIKSIFDLTVRIILVTINLYIFCCLNLGTDMYHIASKSTFSLSIMTNHLLTIILEMSLKSSIKCLQNKTLWTSIIFNFWNVIFN